VRGPPEPNTCVARLVGRANAALVRSPLYPVWFALLYTLKASPISENFQCSRNRNDRLSRKF
jgi:hypothetical protein